MFSVQPVSPPPQSLEQEPIRPETPQNSKFSFLKSAKVWPIVVLLVLLIPTSAYFLAKNSEPKQIACTMEAKLCPNGTSVGRSGPKCEFSPCPTPTSDLNREPTGSAAIANWKTYNQNNYSIKIPPALTYFNSGGILASDNWEEKSKYAIQIQPYQNNDINPFSRDGFIIGNSEEILVSGYKTTKIIRKGSSDEIVLIDVGPIKNKETNYLITLLAYSPYILTENDLKTFDQILSTFKFTTCTPRPTCLDATPRCLIPETADMCPAK